MTFRYLMKMYFRHLSLCPGRGPSPSLMHYRQLGVVLFYRLVDCLAEETSVCPLMRNLLTISFEKLGQTMVSEHADQCLPLLQRICSKPELASFLTAIFTPGCSETDAFLQMYHMISEMTDANSSLAFTLLSKMNVDAWATKAAQEGNAALASNLIALVGESFKRTGPKVVRERQLIHDLHRTHLSALLLHDFPAHYAEIVYMLLVLTESGALDPTIWIDLTNAFLPSDVGRLQTCSTSSEIQSKLSLFGGTNIFTDVKEVTTHFVLLPITLEHFLP